MHLPTRYTPSRMLLAPYAAHHYRIRCLRLIPMSVSQFFKRDVNVHQKNFPPQGGPIDKLHAFGQRLKFFGQSEHHS
jgi:hypothetical protein